MPTASTYYVMLTAAVRNSFEEDVGSTTYKFQNSFPCFLLFNPIMLRSLLLFGSGLNTVRRDASTTVRNEESGLQVWGDPRGITAHV
jgi:hypothetical protein